MTRSASRLSTPQRLPVNWNRRARRTPQLNVTEAIRSKAREIGFNEVGFTKHDKRFTYTRKKRWIRFPHAICLALEQDYVQTQSIPSMDAEYAHFGTYEMEGAFLLDLADHIRSLGYHAQVHSPNDNSAPYIPMFVSAGLGQLGANGQLLSPHFGSRARLAMITTDAPVNYDEPVDYGIHEFCQQCQVCANRCPGRAIVRDKVWWRGVEKNKLIYERCRPVMARYEGCGRLHEDLPDSALWHARRHGALRRDRRGARQGHAPAGRLHVQGQGVLWSRRVAAGSTGSSSRFRTAARKTGCSNSSRSA